MKTYDETRIRQAEVAQLILLHSLFSLRESKEIIFQGGTALRWFHGGLRFSEDLDFVTSLSRNKIRSFVDSVAEQIRRQLVASLGTGTLSVKEKKSQSSSFKAFLDFQPSTARRKISVKIELERLVAGTRPDTDRTIMQASPAVSYLLQKGDLKTPGAPVIINVETPAEILSDKLRALMEREYTKGRDFFDVWFLTGTLRVSPDPEMLKRKLDMYEAPFTIATPAAFYANLGSLSGRAKEILIKEIESDLSRFLTPDVLEALKQNGFRDLIMAVQGAFNRIQESGLIDFGTFRTRQKGAGR
jgi:predicted nucleotidyltransferase component of viral defense system